MFKASMRVSAVKLALVALMLFELVQLSDARAATPGIINYQGRVQVAGQDFTGSGQFKFALVSPGGTTTYWSNDNTSTTGNEPTAAVALNVSKGLYSVLLGDTQLTNMTNAIPATVFANNDVRLRVWFNDGTNGSQVLAPDQRIAAVGYALVADTVSGKVNVNSDATSPGIIANANTPLNAAGFFSQSDPSQNATTLVAFHTGGGQVAAFHITNATNSSSTISADTAGTGTAASFSINNNASTSAILNLQSTSTNGYGIYAKTDQQLLLYQHSNDTSVVRIDNNGKGFFNGGTQTGGADVAEAFQVIGERSQYEPGDVLILSTVEATKVEKSSAPYSTLVSGVHATKPGVLLTERNIDADNSDLVPMGVVGVIPTKVCVENGAIKIGDLLVTSSIPGHAMKGTDKEKMMGAIIGKALENFSGATPGKIKVLVNVK